MATGPEGARSLQGALINQPSDVALRPGVQADARSIAEVHVETWRVAYRGQVPADYLESLSVDQRESMWRAMLAETGTQTFVLDHDARVVGFANVSTSRDKDAAPATGELAAIYVLPERWGHGAGHTLMASAVDALRDAGNSIAKLWVLETNSRARAFYEAHGWAADGATKVEERGSFVLREVRYRTTI